MTIVETFKEVKITLKAIISMFIYNNYEINK